MLNSQNLLNGKGKYLTGAILLLFIAVTCVAFGMTDRDDFDIARREILLRRIGHELLLQSGDSTSRVLPVKETAKNEYRISFEKPLTFQADSLVNITRRLLAQDPLASDYVVNVLQSGKPGVAYGYAISERKKNDIVACIGRKQPKAAYIIAIKFKQAGIISVNNRFLLGGLPFLAFVGFVLFRFAKPRSVVPDHPNAGLITLGNTLFDVKNRKLIVNDAGVTLTGTEMRLLHIFATSPGEIIARSRLQKEIWEDEGVIVGRSLDMFISKLRKKMELDPNINIVVVRGSGYKLQIS